MHELEQLMGCTANIFFPEVITGTLYEHLKTTKRVLLMNFSAIRTNDLEQVKIFPYAVESLHNLK